MNVLGLIYQEDFGHPAACLLQDGKLTAFAEEERFVRVKQARGYFPGRSIRYCLDAAGLGISDVDHIGFGWDANRYTFHYPLFLGRSYIKHSLLKRKETAPRNKDRPNQGSAVIDGLKDILSNHPRNMKQKISFGLREVGFSEDRVPPIAFIKHHLAHAASAHYCSGFADSAVLVYDGHGEENTITFWRGTGSQLELLHETNIPNSLGWFYSLFTEYLGWDPNEGEVKLMGLAPFGKPDAGLKRLVDEILRVTPTGIELNTDYTFYNDRTYGSFYSDLLVDKLGAPRKPDDEITDRHRDIAFAVQSRLEEAGIHLARLCLQHAGSRSLCLAGGVALNCKMNGVIHRENVAERLFVQPISYDAGVALGAAMVVSRNHGCDPRFKLDHLHWGPEFSNDQIETILIRNKLRYRRVEDVEEVTARLIANGKIVGWFQGRMEAGPRALGGRSILADPRGPSMKDKVNDYVKFREGWRPFALSILDEEKESYLVSPADSPFMVNAFLVREDKRTDIESAMHWIDHSTRPQTVRREIHPRYWKLIKSFQGITGVPGVLNTSFNVKGEPVCCTPDDAIRCFFGTGMDAVVLGNFIVEK